MNAGACSWSYWARGAAVSIGTHGACSWPYWLRGATVVCAVRHARSRGATIRDFTHSACSWPHWLKRCCRCVRTPQVIKQALFLQTRTHDIAMARHTSTQATRTLRHTHTSNGNRHAHPLRRTHRALATDPHTRIQATYTLRHTANPLTFSTLCVRSHGCPMGLPAGDSVRQGRASVWLQSRSFDSPPLPVHWVFRSQLCIFTHPLGVTPHHEVE